MYKKGDAKLLINLSALSEEEQERHWDNCDYSDDHVSAPEAADCRQVAALPHSCGEWVIGGPVEIADLIADLTALLAQGKQDRVLPEE